MKLSRRSVLARTAATLAAPALGALGAGSLAGRAAAQARQLEARRCRCSATSNIRKASSISTTSIRMRRRAARCGRARSARSTISIPVVSGVKGSIAIGTELFTETLTTPALDEVSTEYGLLAEAVSYPDDYSSVTYRLRANARWHDGKPVTPDDVIFSFDVFKKNSPFYGAYYRHVVKVEKTGEREITFTFDGPGNRELPQIVGQLPVLPKHWWEGTDKSGRKRDVTQTTLEPPLGSGPYRLKDFAPGRTLVYEKVDDYWGKDLNVIIGTRNFQTIRYEYFRDSTVALEAFKGDQVDWRTENSAKNWATSYDFPAVRDKRVVLEEFPIRNFGVMQAFAFNIRRDKFKDRARAPRLQLRLRFRGNEPADFFRPVQAHRQLFRGHRTRRHPAFRKARNWKFSKRARQGAGGLVHQALHQSGRRQSAGRAQQFARGARACSAKPVTRSRDTKTGQCQDRRTIRRRVPGR